MNNDSSSNSQPWRFGAGLWLFGQFVDRYAADAYGPPVSTLEAIAKAGTVKDLSVLDINYPFTDGVSVEDVKEALKTHGLSCHAVTPHIYMREYARGAFTNPDAEVRAAAVARCKEAIPVARALGAKYVKFWPGQDGFDYPLQADYRQLWSHTVQGIRQVVESAPDMQFAIEYKFKEPRTHMTLSTAARTLLAIDDVGLPNLGVVMDLGHSLLAKETPSDALALCAGRKRLTSVELNDNWREWDDDLTVGAVHIIEALEFMITLRSLGWSDPLLLDQFPFREDPVTAASQSIAVIKALDAMASRIDKEKLAAIQANQDALGAQRLVHELLLGAKF